jgi:hypothetical protein
MRKIRNPRFAPEVLERKLCPSGFVGNAVASGPAPTAYVMTVTDVSSLSNPTSSDVIDGTPLNSSDALASHVLYVNDDSSGSQDPYDNAPASFGPGPEDLSDVNQDPSPDPGPGPDPDPEPEPDPLPGPGPDPGSPVIPGIDPTDPPFVPLPPAPIGPAGPGF